MSEAQAFNPLPGDTVDFPAYDRFLASLIVELGLIQFGPNEKNKNDSPSCLFDPRKLLSSPEAVKHISDWIANISIHKASASAIVGMATSGIAWATAASVKSQQPLLYVRKSIEKGVSSKLVEGIPPEDRRVILVDDLIFAGESICQALEILQSHELEVTDVVVIIDRQLQRVCDGPSVAQRAGIQFHSMINMSDIVDFLIETENINAQQLKDLIRDYRRFKRWDMPRFAQS